jgi:hypothetical protein
MNDENEPSAAGDSIAIWGRLQSARARIWPSVHVCEPVGGMNSTSWMSICTNFRVSTGRHHPRNVPLTRTGTDSSRRYLLGTLLLAHRRATQGIQAPPSVRSGTPSAASAALSRPFWRGRRRGGGGWDLAFPLPRWSFAWSGPCRLATYEGDPIPRESADHCLACTREDNYLSI